jgi:hypothetical protein
LSDYSTTNSNQPGSVGNPGSGISVNVPQSTSPDYISMILGNLPNIFSMFGPQKPLEPKPDFTPYYIIGAAAIVFLINKK